MITISETLVVVFIWWSPIAFAQFGSVNQNFYPTPDWATVPASSTPRNIRNANLAYCICDLTADVCDSLCCCDSAQPTVPPVGTPIVGDCNSQQLRLFPTCLSNGIPPSPVPACGDVANANNLPSGVSYTNDYANNQLCIVYNNNPSAGNFFAASVPTPTSAQDFSRAIVYWQRSNWIVSDEILPTPAPATPAPTYQASQPVGAAYSSDGGNTFVTLGGGAWTLPVALPGASHCLLSSTIGFMKNLVPPRPCTVTDPNLATTCGTASMPQSYSANFFVNALYLTTGASNPSTFVVGTSVVGPTNTATYPIPVLNSTTGTCNNIVTEVTYTILTDGGGLISSWSASVVLSNIRTASPAVFSQRVTAQWFAIPNAADPNERIRSGRPGYRQGLPLLVGTLLTQGTAPNIKQAINQMIYGLSIVAPTFGACDTRNRVQVMFGQNIFSSCALPLNFTSLASLCQTTVSDSVHPVFFFSANITRLQPVLYLGLWGDSSFQSVADWVPFDPNPQSVTGSVWDPQRGICAGYINAMNVEVLWTQSGAAGAPQPRILGANVQYASTAWAFTSIDRSATQHFFFTITVTFAQVVSGPNYFSAPAPALLPSLPQDLFYPFTQSAATPLYSLQSLWPFVSIIVLGVGWMSLG
mmetsp:Transcript_36931/g.59747  ORF Transcript_36931/g.59747 Transcript_36931/m.59747 type:complete len:641 (-) Transcript_36931:209-2131(-)